MKIGGVFCLTEFNKNSIVINGGLSMGQVLVKVAPNMRMALVQDQRIIFVVKVDSKMVRRKGHGENFELYLDPDYREVQFNDKYPFSRVLSEITKLSDQYQVLKIVLKTVDPLISVNERKKLGSSLSKHANDLAVVEFVSKSLLDGVVSPNIWFRDDVVSCMPRAFRKIVQEAKVKREEQKMTPV
jgi:hypothetical protein